MQDRLQVVIVGTGPYGLSIAAHLRAAGVRFRIFGSPMSTWRQQMPKGMFLKSDGFASSLSDPKGSFTLRHFCLEQGIPYHDTRIPVRLETFTAYGLAFQQRFVPELEDRKVTSIRRNGGLFSVTIEDGETVETEKVVMAVGISHFHHIPAEIRHLPGELLSHSSAHSTPECFQGREVTVLGSGASGIDLAALLHQAGARVTIVARSGTLEFHDPPGSKPRSLWKQLRHPPSGIGPGLRSRFYTDAPLLFHKLPANLRVKIVRTHLRPAAGWPMKEMVLGKFPALLGYSVQSVQTNGKGVKLHLVGKDGSERRHATEHLIAATGYKPDIGRLLFLDEELRSQIKRIELAPALSTDFQSSVPGLYFVGLAAAYSFGPVLRFAVGSAFTAQHLTRCLTRSLR